MKHLVLRYLFFVLLLGGLMACEQENDAIVHGPGQRTVLIYFVADNNLASYVDGDLAELKEGIAAHGLFDSQHLLAYVDKGGEASLIELIEKNDAVVEKVIKTYPSRNSTGVAEMQEVFDDVFNNEVYQAESYGFIYWSHCDGWMPYPLPDTRWVGQDTGNGKDNRMNISELKQVLDAAPHFDFIMFDACFMQSVEVAYELQGYADYYIGSPTETPGPGAPYDAIFPYLLEKGAAAKLAEVYFGAYNELYNPSLTSGNPWTLGVSICALKTAGLQQLAAVTQQALGGIDKASVDYTALRTSVFNYDKRYSLSNLGYYDFDAMMGELLEPSAYEEWKKTFDSVIVYWNTTQTNYSSSYGSFPMTGTNGVSHYIPSSPDTDACEAYRSLSWYKDAGISQLW